MTSYHTDLSHFAFYGVDFDCPFALPLGELRVGRTRDNDVVLPSGSLAKRHSRLTVREDGVEITDLNSTQGMYVNGVRMDAKRVNLRIGDRVSLGDFTLVLGLTGLQAEPPGELIVIPATGEGVDRGWSDGDVSDATNDELWAAYYLRWRRMLIHDLPDGAPRWGQDYHWPVEAVSQMCSPPLLQWLRDLLIDEDDLEWFLGCRDLFIDAIANARHGIGPLLAFDIAMRHGDEWGRQHAEQSLAELARRDSHMDVATAVLDRVPRDATSISALVAPVFERAMSRQTRWGARRFLDYMSRPSLAEAAEWIVFSLHSPSGELVDTFRPSDGSFLSLGDVVGLGRGHQVGVAAAHELGAATRRRWLEHLADFEIVQPFAQFDHD